MYLFGGRVEISLSYLILRKVWFGMYQLNESIVNQILKRKFNSFVGILCERIENLSTLKLDSTQLIKQLKFELKKDAYNTMREIEEQISSFSEGTAISVNLNNAPSK